MSGSCGLTRRPEGSGPAGTPFGAAPSPGVPGPQRYRDTVKRSIGKHGRTAGWATAGVLGLVAALVGSSAVKAAPDSWAALGAVGSFGQFVAVVATLIYVARQFVHGRREADRARFSERLRALESVLDTVLGPQLHSASESTALLLWDIKHRGRSADYESLCVAMEHRLSSLSIARTAFGHASHVAAEMPDGRMVGDRHPLDWLTNIWAMVESASTAVYDAASPVLRIHALIRQWDDVPPQKFPFATLLEPVGEAVWILHDATKEYERFRSAVRDVRRSLPARP